MIKMCSAESVSWTSFWRISQEQQWAAAEVVGATQFIKAIQERVEIIDPNILDKKNELADTPIQLPR